MESEHIKDEIKNENMENDVEVEKKNRSEPISTKLSEMDKKLLFEQLIPFFNNSKHFEILKMMIIKNAPKKRDLLPETLGDNTPIPLRVIDHTCTRYASERDAYCTILTRTGEIVKKNLKGRYDSKLKQHSKKRFDVYKRQYPNYGLLEIQFKNGDVIETTLAQLNFFKWAISEGVLDFIRKNYIKIGNHLKEQKKNKTEKNKRKRVEQQTFVYPVTENGYTVDFSLY
jgi:hypothetical protein